MNEEEAGRLTEPPGLQIALRSFLGGHDITRTVVACGLLFLPVLDLARARGHPRVWLGVDAQNPTGVLALYLKAGMRTERRYVVCVRDVRPR